MKLSSRKELLKEAEEELKAIRNEALPPSLEGTVGKYGKLIISDLEKRREADRQAEKNLVTYKRHIGEFAKALDGLNGKYYSGGVSGFPPGVIKNAVIQSTYVNGISGYDHNVKFKIGKDEPRCSIEFFITRILPKIKDKPQ